MRVFFFLLLFIGNCTICSMRELPITNLEHIDFFQLECVKEASNNTHTRITYRDEKNGYFYKIWTSGYWRSNYFFDALKAGFFDGLTSLVGIIYDEKDCCRGYITSEGSIIKDRIEIERIITGKFFILVPAPAKQQNDQAYIDFFARLLEQTKNTGYAFIDLTMSNLIFIDGEYKLIDLESVLPLNKLNEYTGPSDYHHYIRTISK